MGPAETIIRKCGGGNFARGVNRVSTWAGVDKSRIYRWSWSKLRGGTGGVIPAQHHQTILNGARNEGIDLAPDDFFAADGSAPEPLPPPVKPKRKRRDDAVILVSGVPQPFAYINGERVGLDDVKRLIRDLERDAA